MRYHQMHLLFAGLARYDGRLSVLTARSQGPDALWMVVLRDHVRHTWLRLRRIEQLAPDAQENALLARWERPPTEFEALAEPEPEGAAMTWLELLSALGALEHSARGWSLVAIEASWPAPTEPRCRLVLQRVGLQNEADSFDAFEQIVAAG